MKSLKFRPEALESANAAEEITDLIQIVHPYSWIVLFAIILFVVFLFFWSLFARIPIYINGEGMLTSNRQTSYVDSAIIYINENDAQKIPLHAQVLLTPYRTDNKIFSPWEGKVISIDKFPSTRETMIEVLHDKLWVAYLRDNHLTTPLYVHMRLPQKNAINEAGVLVKAKIKIRDQAPIEFIIPAADLQ